MFQSRPKGQKKCSDQHSFNFLSQVSEQVCVDSKNEMERRMTRAKELFLKNVPELFIFCSPTLMFHNTKALGKYTVEYEG